MLVLWLIQTCVNRMCLRSKMRILYLSMFYACVKLANPTANYALRLNGPLIMSSFLDQIMLRISFIYLCRWMDCLYLTQGLRWDEEVGRNDIGHFSFYISCTECADEIIALIFNKQLVRRRAVVVAQLVERSLPIPVIGKKLFIHWTFVYCQLCIEKTKIKKQWPGMAHFLKNS